MRFILFALIASLTCSCSENPGNGPSTDLALGGGNNPDAASGLDLAAAGDAGVFGFTENFSAADGAPWPTPWTMLGGVAAQTVQGGRGRLVPIASSYALARMGVPAGVRDMEVSFQVMFESLGTQGVGYYVRQNGGWLRNTATHGQGYAVFIEGFRGSRIGVWKEEDGQEIELTSFTGFATPLQSNVLYGVRLRVKQATPTMTQLQARIWNAAQSEPSTWQIDTMDSTPILQNISGGMAVDSYSSQSSGTISAAIYVGKIGAVPAS